MKKIKIIISIALLTVGIAFVAESCDTRTYDEISGPKTNITYTKDIKPIMSNNCTGCHSSNGGQEPYLDNYQDVKNSIEAVLSDMNNGTMPPDGPLPSSTISVVQTWKDSGMPE